MTTNFHFSSSVFQFQVFSVSEAMDVSEKTKLFVGGVSKETTEETLRQHFSRFGEVEESLIIRDRFTGIARGFGFVTFTSPFMATEALRTQHFILGRKVSLKGSYFTLSCEFCIWGLVRFSFIL